MSMLVAMLLLGQATAAQAPLPLVPDRPVVTRYRAVEGAAFKTGAELRGLGYQQTGQHLDQYRCKSGCLTVGVVHAVFFGREVPGERLAFICPNPVQVIDLNRPVSAAAPVDRWRCYGFTDVTDRKDGRNG